MGEKKKRLLDQKKGKNHPVRMIQGKGKKHSAPGLGLGAPTKKKWRKKINVPENSVK